MATLRTSSRPNQNIPKYNRNTAEVTDWFVPVSVVLMSTTQDRTRSNFFSQPPPPNRNIYAKWNAFHNVIVCFDIYKPFPHLLTLQKWFVGAQNTVFY